MNLALSEEEQLVQNAAREFAEKELKPLSSEIDKQGEIPGQILKKLSELGFMGMLTPREYNGSGFNNFCLTLAQIEINKVCASTGVTMSVHNSLVQGPLNRFANEQQKKKYLSLIASGEWIGAYSLSEPLSGSDSAALRTQAVRKGNQYVLNGTKVFVTNGAIANLFIVFARTGEDRNKGISAFIVERGYKGFAIGKPEKKLGIRGSSTVQLFLEDCHVPVENRLGEEGEGFKIAMNTLDGGRIGISAQAIGIAKACLEESIKYAKQREQFGHLIGEYEAIQWKISNMATDIEAATALTLHAARLRDTEVDHTVQSAMAKLFSSTMVNNHATEAVQIHGGVGYIRDFPVERYFRDAKITEIYEGTSEIQRLVIARKLLGIKTTI